MKTEKIIVFVNGCFDLLHEGHLHLLKEAKKHGDHLIVGLNSDKAIRKLKGEERPFDNQEIRKQKLLDTKLVDEVTLFEDSPIELIKYINPDVIVRGYDQTIEKELSEFRFERISQVPGVSTTILVKKK